MTDERTLIFIDDISDGDLSFASPKKSNITSSAPKKRRSYLRDSIKIFFKAPSSLCGIAILAIIVLYSIFAPIISLHSVDEKDALYKNMPPFIPSHEDKILGAFDGSVTRDSQNDKSLLRLKAIALETGRDPLISVAETVTKTVIIRGEEQQRTVYTLKINAYYEKGMVYRVFSYGEFEEIQAWQNENGIQVIYPYSENEDGDPNLWYTVGDDGEIVPNYLTDKSKAGAEYNSVRIEGDDGSYVYSYAKSGTVEARVNYYNYYIYQHGHEPTYVLGTNSSGQDLFSAIGIGTRFSLIFATLVATINIIIGIFIGAVQGYYGGAVDMVIDRGIDILSGVPFMILATLFQLYLAEDVGIVPSFLFAFVLTGWISTSNVVRKQFYRYKKRDYVTAARTLGVKDSRLMFTHIFPNAIGTIITSCALVVPSVIYMETNLTYLGIVDLNKIGLTSIGTLMSDGQKAIMNAPNAVIWPTVLIALLLISFNLIANGLRDSFNPLSGGSAK